MISKLADYLSVKFYHALLEQTAAKSTPPKDVGVYRYAMELALTTLFQGLLILSLSFVFHVTTESLIYVVTFSSLRLFAGGIHAKTHFRCALFYNIVHFLSIYFILQIKSDTLAGWILLFSSVIAVVLVFQYAPVASRNKPLSQGEILKYRKISRLIILIQCSLACISYTYLHYHGHIERIAYPLLIGLAYLNESITLLPFFHQQDTDDK